MVEAKLQLNKNILTCKIFSKCPSCVKLYILSHLLDDTGVQRHEKSFKLNKMEMKKQKYSECPIHNLQFFHISQNINAS